MSRSLRLLPLLPLLLALAACDSGEKPVASQPDAEPKETIMGDIQATIDYGTGATQVKAYKKATTKIKQVSAEKNKDLEEALQP